MRPSTPPLGEARPSDAIAVPLPKAYRLLNHGPTVLVTSAADGRRNVMSAAWNMALDFDPPKVCVVIDKNTYTRELVDRSGAFALNVPSRRQAQLTLAVGDSSGRDADKFARQGIQTWAASEIDAPLISGCLAWLECRVINEPHNQSRYDLYIGEVVAAWSRSGAFSNGHWTLADDADRSIHYIAGGQFFETGAAFRVEKDGD
jgi:flavin reductase (DIM6/NTAB) family NADH-FMN oxidoreductase RutF